MDAARAAARALANWLALLRPGGTVLAVDGYWFADGLACEAAKRSDYADFGRLYDESVVAALPFAQLNAAGPLTIAFADAGFEDVRATPLPEIEHLERASLPDIDEIRPRFIISAHRPR